MAHLKEAFQREVAKPESDADERKRLKSRIAELENELKKAATKYAALRTFVPEDLHFEVLPIWKELGGNLNATRIVSLFIGAISSAKNNDAAFANRFRVFDDELYALLRDDEAKLKDVRQQFKKLLDGRTVDCEVTWDLVGDPGDPDIHYGLGLFDRSPDNTMKVMKVRAALIRIVEGKCIKKAKVELT